MFIKKLKEAWFSSLWKVTMDEFAMWSTNETSAFKKAVNPWWTNRIPGGSSGWSAASVAAWLAPAALGTDTGWSIRQPASMCNLVWFKPSYWRNSRNWVMAMASSLDCPGTLTKTVTSSFRMSTILLCAQRLKLLFMGLKVVIFWLSIVVIFSDFSRCVRNWRSLNVKYTDLK